MGSVGQDFLTTATADIDALLGKHFSMPQPIAKKALAVSTK